MPRKESEAVPEGSGPVPQQEEFGSGEPTLADVYRVFEERFDQQQKIMDSFFDGVDSCFDRWNRKLDEISDETRVRDQHVTSLEYGARQPRLAMEADGPANTKTCERTEGAALAVQAMHEDSCTTAQKFQDGPKTSISFGVMAEPPDLPCREDVLVEDGATSPESCLPSLETRSSTASLWWLSSHRRNFHSNGDHRRQATSSVLLERGGELEEEKFTDFNSIRLVRQ